jgi:Protein of unknown function (DUF3293)
MTRACRPSLARDPALVAEYVATSYIVYTPNRRTVLRVGQRNRVFERLLRRCRVRYWAFVSACNPGSRRLSCWRNAARASRLAGMTKAWRLRTLPGEGVADDPDWGAEVSLLILGIAPARALKLARQFGQHAVVVGRRGDPARLEWC